MLRRSRSPMVRPLSLTISRMTARTSLGVVHRASAVWMWSTVRLLTRWASSENLASSFMWASTNCWTSVSRPSGWERTMVSFGCGRVLLGGLAEGSPYAALVFVGLFVDVVLLGGGEVDGLDEGVADGCLGEYAGVRALCRRFQKDRSASLTPQARTNDSTTSHFGTELPDAAAERVAVE